MLTVPERGSAETHLDSTWRYRSIKNNFSTATEGDCSTGGARRVPRGLTPRVKPTRLMHKPPSLMAQLRRGLKTLIRSNCVQLRRNATPLKTHAFGVVRRVLSGEVESPTLTDAPGVRVLLPADPFRGGRGELNSPAVAVRTKTAKPRGLSPRYFTRRSCPPMPSTGSGTLRSSRHSQDWSSERWRGDESRHVRPLRDGAHSRAS
jgi:hypothetical protein